METILTYNQPITREPSEFKKVLIGFVYKFAVEIIFFSLAAFSCWLLWYLAFHYTGINDRQHAYVYNPYELKYFVITIGGVKRRIAIKRFFNPSIK